MNDADIETNELNVAADHIDRLRRKGICTHGYYTTKTNRNRWPVRCLDCGKIFPTEEALHEEREQYL